MCHRIAFIPLHGPRLPPPPNALASNSNSNSGGEDNVFVFLEGRSKNAFVGGGAGSRSAVSDMEMEMEMETVECGGAILSLSISRDDRFAMANVRPFTVREWSEGVDVVFHFTSRFIPTVLRYYGIKRML